MLIAMLLKNSEAELPGDLNMNDIDYKICQLLWVQMDHPIINMGTRSGHVERATRSFPVDIQAAARQFSHNLLAQ